MQDKRILRDRKKKYQVEQVSFRRFAAWVFQVNIAARHADRMNVLSMLIAQMKHLQVNHWVFFLPKFDSTSNPGVKNSLPKRLMFQSIVFQLPVYDAALYRFGKDTAIFQT